MSSSSYLLEKLPHLKQLKLFFKPRFLPERYQVSVDKYCVAFIRKDKKEDVIKIHFDCEINKDGINCNIKDKMYFLTLPIIQNEYNDETDDFPTPNELDINRYSLIKCKFCENVIYNQCKQRLNKIYPLPSEYWLELSDMWFCCQSHQIDFNAQEIRAKKDALLIGKLFIILHSNNIIKKSISLKLRTINDEYSVNVLSQNEQQRKKNKKHNHSHGHSHSHQHEHKHDNNTDDNHTSWDGVQAFNCYCNRCETLLGISYKTMDHNDNEHQDQILDEYHLWKFELSIEGSFKIPFARNDNKMDNIYHWYYVENYFSTKILEIKKARTVHKFLIYDYNLSIFIKINLMSTNCFIKCPLFNQSLENKKMSPALKLLFVNCSNLSFQENNEWIKKQNGQCITSSTENCQLLLKYLIEYNELYPLMIQKQRFPFNMKMTFLRLLSRTWCPK